MAFNHDRRPFSTDRRPVLGKSLDDAIDDFLSGGGSIPEVSSPVRWPHLTQGHLVQALNVKEERHGGMERLGDSYTLLFIYIPIGSMYAIYGNIYHQYTPNVSIYTIHGSYGIYIYI